MLDRDAPELRCDAWVAALLGARAHLHATLDLAVTAPRGPALDLADPAVLLFCGLGALAARLDRLVGLGVEAALALPDAAERGDAAVYRDVAR